MKTRSVILTAAAAGIGAAVATRTLLRKKSGDWSGRVAVVTGASRGLGLLLARDFAREGCAVAICARDEDELRDARKYLQEHGADQVYTEKCDVTERSDVERFISDVAGRFGSIDILVNNAGEIQVGPLEAMTVDDFERAMQIMFWGAVYPTLAAIPHLKRRKNTRIVNITSIGGKVAVPHLLPYSCAKFALVGFSEGLRAELAKYGVKVVTIAPGLMRTGSYVNAIFKGDQDKEAAWFSLGATTPGASMGAERAARQIVNATRRGDAEKVLTLPANVAARFHGLFPGMTADILGLVDRLILPRGNDTTAKRGKETGTLQSPLFSAITILGKLAARRFLQRPEPA